MSLNQLAAAATALAFSACAPDLDFELDLDLDLGCDSFQLFPGPCVDNNNPMLFLDPVGEMVLGTNAEVDTLVHESIAGFTVESTDPDVVEVALEGETVLVRAVGEGSASVKARALDGSWVYAYMPITVQTIAAVEFHYFFTNSEPITELAGVAGSADAVNLVYRAADGRALELSEGAATLSTEGSLVIDGDNEPRLSDFYLEQSGELYGQQVGVGFVAAGDGELVVTSADASEFRLPITVVASADEFTVTAEHDQATVDSRMFFFLHASTAAGMTVAGHRGHWSISPPDAGTLTSRVDPASEVVLEPHRVDTIEVTVDVDGLLVSTEVEVGAAL